MDYEQILNLIDRIENSKFNICELDFENTYINLSKLNTPNYNKNKLVNDDSNKTPFSSYNEADEQAKESYPKTIISDKESNDELKDKLVVNSPIVGTFYCSSAIGKDPFVKVGDTVQEGDVLCIVEAMKVMNEVKSKFNGKIVKVLVANETMVEYNQPLFVIE